MSATQVEPGGQPSQSAVLPHDDGEQIPGLPGQQFDQHCPGVVQVHQYCMLLLAPALVQPWPAVHMMPQPPQLGD